MEVRRDLPTVGDAQADGELGALLRHVPAQAGGGYAVGALVAGLTADALGLKGAMWLVAVLTFISGLVAALRMTETLGARRQSRGGRSELPSPYPVR